MLFEWNIDAYEQAEKLLKEKGKACIIMGTCLGKTTTGAEYPERFNCNALILGPNNAVKDSWKSNSKCKYMTYQTFMNCYKELNYSQFGVVICDECHHLGAERWGEGVLYLIQNKIVPVLGVTATNVRADWNDVAESVFEGCKVVGLDILTGIRNGILNGMQYVNAYYDVEELKEDFDGLVDDILIRKLDLEINNTPTVQAILKDKMPNRPIKGIVFVSGYNDLEKAEKILKEVFPKVPCKKLHSRFPFQENEKTRKWFREECKEGFIITVNMVNEGVHYTGVNTLIMFRRSTSSVTYYQQLGRVISLKKYGDPQAIVFDFVNNNNLISLIAALSSNKEISEKLQRRKPLSEDEIKELKDELPKQIIIDDFTTSLDLVLQELKEASLITWTKEELTTLDTYWPIEGIKVKARLPRRTEAAIKNQAFARGLKYIDPRLIWTENELAILDSNFKELGPNGVARLLNYSKTRHLIILKAEERGLVFAPTDPWKKDEKELMSNFFEKLGAVGMAKLLPNKTVEEIRRKAIEMNLKKKERRILINNAIVKDTLNDATTYLLEQKDVSDDFDRVKSRIRGCLSGVQKQYKGYIFKYIID